MRFCVFGTWTTNDRLLDYGVVARVPAGSARILPREFCSVPPAAVPCRMFKVRAVGRCAVPANLGITRGTPSVAILVAFSDGGRRWG